MNPFTKVNTQWNLAPLPSANAPVFLLSAIWRSGSTLVQRLICSDPDIFLWGEPYGDAGIIPHLNQSARALLREGWPHQMHYLTPEDPEAAAIIKEPHKFWIANIYPPVHYIRKSYRDMLDTLFVQSLETLNRKRFGIKEVRYDGEVAQFLQWLYPDAQFVFLCRNPYDAWASYKGAMWYYQWPKVLVKDVMLFAKLWRHNFESFLSFRGDPNAQFLFFEDLMANPETHLSNLEEHCNIKIDRATLDIRIRGIKKPIHKPTPKEEQVIKKICGTLAEPFGYLGYKKTRLNK